MHRQLTHLPVVLDLERPVSRHIDGRARQAIENGAVHLTAVNGLDAERRAVMLAAGVRLATTIRQLKGRVNGYPVEVDQREHGLTVWCGCLANANGRLCYHAISLYRAATGTEVEQGGQSA